jgi:alkanesulfonate monooxygenase SsuD/methylene tetrahydromethanopterin reductase-like flavin-dependent oxidoreductase (luciferase family)
MDFAVRNCDWVFTTMPRFEDYAPRVESIHQAAAGYGRDVRVATMLWVVPEATDELAQATYDWIESEIDREAVLNFIDSMQRTSTRDLWDLNLRTDDPWGGVGRETFISIALGITASHVVGGYETVAEKLRSFKEAGLESLLICFFDPQKGLHQMQDDIIPILTRMGVRK